MNNIATIIGVLDKDALLEIEYNAPETIAKIAEVYYVEQTKNNDSLTSILGQLDKSELIDIETNAPSTIMAADATRDWQAEALNNMAAIMGLIDKDELLEIEYNAHGTIRSIAGAAEAGHPTALNNIADTLSYLIKTRL